MASKLSIQAILRSASPKRFRFLFRGYLTEPSNIHGGTGVRCHIAISHIARATVTVARCMFYEVHPQSYYTQTKQVRMSLHVHITARILYRIIM